MNKIIKRLYDSKNDEPNAYFSAQDFTGYELHVNDGAWIIIYK